LLQFNAKRRNVFTLETILLWEHLAGILAIAIARFRAQEAQRAAEPNFKSILESLGEGIIVADCSGHVLHWNLAALEMHSFTLAREGKFLLEDFQKILEISTLDGRILTPEERPLHRTIAGEPIPPCEYRVRRIDLENWTRIFRFSGTTIFDHDRKPTLGVLAVTDVTQSRQAEEALRQSEERSRAYFDSIDDAFVVHEILPDGTIGRFTEVNQPFCQWLGYTPEELLTMSPQDLDDPASGVLASDIAKHFAANESVLFEQVLVAKDGRRIPVEIHSRPFVLDGKPAAIATLRDISERKRAEKALHESEQRLTLAMKAAQLGIFEYDFNGNTIHVSPEFRSIYGFEAEEVVTREAVRSRILPEDREQVLADFMRSWDLTGDGLIKNQHRITHPKGIRWMMVRAEIFFAGAGAARHPIRAIGTVLDITRQKQAELELRASQQQLRTALDAAELGVITRNMDSPLLDCDELTRSIFGWGPDQPITMSDIDAAMPPEDRERFHEQRESLLSGNTGEDYSIEYHIRRPDGEMRWVTLRRDMVPDSAGKPNRMVGVVRDITQSKRAQDEKLALEQQFLHAQKMEAIGRLAGGVAHDFNNILMVIRSYAEIMELSLPPEHKLLKNVEAILKASDRAASLTGQMLAFSRKQVLSPIPLSLSAAVAEAAKMLQRLIGEDIELRVLPRSTWMIRADPDQIAQVLLNLSVNARDAMPEGGVLTISTFDVDIEADRVGIPPGSYAVVSVSDTGTGIPPDVQQRMFEPFFTTKSVGKGTGLGLSTVYGIVTQSGGHMLVNSEAGQGSIFTIYLPRVQDRAASVKLTNAERLPGGTETLLVVEDEEALRSSIVEFLTGLGYNVVCAASGPQALQTTAGFNGLIDLMVTDVVMPKMSGRELAQILAGQRPEMKTIFMSGYTNDAIVRHEVQEQGLVFLQKPFSLAALARKIRDVLGSPRSSC
jgi:PAS domain S-box-containing protein